MNIVALGNAACKIANCLSKHSVYTIYKIDVEIEESKNTKSIPKQTTAEEYEQKCPSFKDFFAEVNGDEVTFIVAGSSQLTGCSLRILEELKDKKLTILYIRPDLSLLNDKALQQERITFNVFQQYARSGLFEKVYLISNTTLEDILGDVPITQYYDKLNEMIASTFHFINVYKHIKPIIETQMELPEIARIATFGLHDPKTNEDKFFYPLQYKTSQTYFYAYNKDILEKDGKIFQNIKKQLRERIGENMKVSFGIYATEYPENFVFCEAHTHFIQEERF